ncbi:MAG TPA: hypothetical protein VNO30_07760 [Kofleriaceae bacterium]|nr:hypothetical protein [Kofleriaceae bacterium]
MSCPRSPVLALLALVALTTSAFAGPGKVMVLPLDGDADPAIRAKYSASVQRLARTLDAKVTTGNATFSDTAVAIGCDPKAPACAEDVRATLGVDELIYGTVTKEDGKLVLVVRRVAKGKQRREVTTRLEASDAPARAESELQPLFQKSNDKSNDTTNDTTNDQTNDSPAGGVSPQPPGPPTAENPGDTPRTPLRRQKVLGYAAVGGGATLLLISFALWSSASGLEDDIDAHPVANLNDFTSLVALEDTARSRAWAGNALFLAGLAVGGLGGWILYRDRKAQHTVVAPAPAPGGATLMLGGVF